MAAIRCTILKLAPHIGRHAGNALVIGGHLPFSSQFFIFAPRDRSGRGSIREGNLKINLLFAGRQNLLVIVFPYSSIDPHGSIVARFIDRIAQQRLAGAADLGPAVTLLQVDIVLGLAQRVCIDRGIPYKPEAAAVFLKANVADTVLGDRLRLRRVAAGAGVGPDAILA